MNRRNKKNTIIDTVSEFCSEIPREYFSLVFFGVFFFAIVWETFSYTVINHAFYEDLAENQQTWELEIPVTRGTIHTAPSVSMSEGTVYSTSVDLSDLAIDPQIEGDIDALRDYMTDILYSEMCYLKNIDNCYRDMLRFFKVLEIPDFKNEKSFVKKLISEKLLSLFSEKMVTSVLLKQWLSPDEEREIISWDFKWVYANENGVYVNPEEIWEREAFATQYQKYFWWEYEDIIYSLRQRERRYIPIFSKLSLGSSDTIEQMIEEEFSLLQRGIIDKEESIWGFIILTPHAQRIYPEWQVGSQIVGFLNNAGVWNYGIEWYYEELLRWNPGELISKKDVKGRPIDPISLGNDRSDALEGVDIYTTIDRNVQKIVEEKLEAGVKQYAANKGSIIVMEPKTWKVLSMANYPSYDPNAPWEVYTLKKINEDEYPNPETDLLGKSVFVEDLERWEVFLYNWEKIFLREASREEYIIEDLDKYIYVNDFGAAVYKNDVITALYEPWSIMKAITVAIGIDTGEIQPFEMYNDVGKVTIDNFTISNVDSKCLWYNSFTHALNFSCNVWMIRIVQRVWKALMHKYLHDFGFWEPTNITLQWEAFSRIDPYERWSTAKLLTTSYGLWVSLTPLQMATAYSALANGWLYMQPYIIEKIVETTGREMLFEPQALRRVVKESTAKSVTSMLVDWVDNWVAWNGAVEWYSIAGKTGTSQIAYRGRYETGTASTNASFAWYAPAEDPQFVIVIKLERPRTTIYGWASSAYIFSDLASELLNYYAIPKKSQN